MIENIFISQKIYDLCVCVCVCVDIQSVQKMSLGVGYTGQNKEKRLYKQM